MSWRVRGAGNSAEVNAAANWWWHAAVGIENELGIAGQAESAVVCGIVRSLGGASAR